MASTASASLARLKRGRAPRRLKRLRDRVLDAVNPLPKSEIRHQAVLQTEDEAFRRMAFTFALIGLNTAVMRSSKEVTKAQYLRFCAQFGDAEEKNMRTLRRLFTLAWEDGTPAEIFARQILALYPDNPVLYRSVVENLWGIAQYGAQGQAAPLKLIRMLSQAFGLSRASLNEIILANPCRPADPFKTLGLPPAADRAHIKARYRELMRIYHPDKLGDATLPEIKYLAEQKAALFNEAYGLLMKRAAA